VPAWQALPCLRRWPRTVLSMKNNKRKHFKQKSRSKGPSKGQSLVELALTLTLLLTLVAGAFDLGSAFFDFISLRDAAQEGAIYGSMYGLIPYTANSNQSQIYAERVAKIVARVQQSSTTPVYLPDFVDDCSTTSPKGICVKFYNSNDTSFSTPITDPCTTKLVQVTVRFNYNIIMPFIGAIIGGQTIPLHATVTNVILTPACP
jgi:Flp pilus assembly protein TadG